MREGYIFSLRECGRIRRIGNKAESLRFLADKGFPIPLTYVCTWDAYVRYAQGDVQVVEEVGAELAAKIDHKKMYAVRSSANLEDGVDLSFAGQFRSVLNVQGVDDILKAVRLIWDTTQSSSIRTYLERKGRGVQDVKMAVIIQAMVSAEVSGVAFSKNPVTSLDEVLVEAVRGSGEALVQDGSTPQRWVNKWGAWTSVPDASKDDQVVPLDLIDDVVRQTKEIATTYGRPVDLEWVFDGRSIKWVQMRGITTLRVPIFSNRLSNEVFPGVIKPLVWSVNVPLVNGAWMTLFTELIGPNDIEPEALAGRFYSRAYFDMAAVGQILELLGLPRESLELLIGVEVGGPDRPTFKPSSKTFALLPRILRFGWDKLRFSRKIDAFLVAMKRQFRCFELQQGQELSAVQLLERIDDLAVLVQETAYYNTVIAVLMRIYNWLLKGQLDRLGVDLEGFDLTGGDEALEAFDPNVELAQLARVYLSLDEDRQTRVRQGGYKQLSTVPGTGVLESGIAQFVERFGHLSNSSSDFSKKPWRESPDLILQMIIDHAPPASGGRDRVQFSDLQIPVLRRPFVRALYDRAQRFQWYREAISSLYTYGYGLFRDLFLALGHHFVRWGSIARVEDVFTLYMAEVRETVRVESPAPNWLGVVRERKAELDRMRGVTPPAMIFGHTAPSLNPDEEGGLKGTPTSRGVYMGPVRILQGIQDIGKVRDGDVLVIPYSDVGWTPLFTRAGAVVAESGGILSHSSIIAREYGIPAVVSVPGACQLADGTRVTVDGHNGTVTVHGEA